MDAVVPHGTRDNFSLVDHTRPDRTGVDLDKPHHVGVQGEYELPDALQIVLIGSEVTRAGYRQIETGACAGRITDVVEEKSQVVVRVSWPNGLP